MHIKTTRPCVLGTRACDADEVVELEDDRAAKVIERGAAVEATEKDIAAAKKSNGGKKSTAKKDEKPAAGKAAQGDKSGE